jgi:hypothetical protein
MRAFGRHSSDRGASAFPQVQGVSLSDPARPGHGETHRLVTTLLDAQEAPALDLIGTYHERWESATIAELEDWARELAADAD